MSAAESITFITNNREKTLSPIYFKMSGETWKSKCKRYLNLITVEPSMSFYMMAFMITSVVEQAFFIHKACRVNHGLNATICDNLTADEHKDINKEVQVTVSTFHQWNDVAGHVGQILLAFFMGAWADRRGRKIPLLMGILAAVFAYITDISSKENRTLRVTIVEVCYLVTMPTGIALGKVLYNKVTNKSYAIMFTINASLLFLAIVYSFIRLDWRTNEKQRPLSEANNVFTDFFDGDHVVQTVSTICKRRPNRQRTYLLILILSMAFYTFQRDEKPMMYLYVQLVLKWTFDTFSNFKTYVSALQGVILLCAIPLLSKVFHWRDTYIMMLGALCHSVARVFYATATVGWLLYVGGAFAAIGPIVAPVIRSTVSKIVPAAERGKVFSILAVADNAVPVISGVLYTQVYNASIHTLPSAIFFLTIATQVMVFAIATLINFTTKDEQLVYEDGSLNEECIQEKES
ncbi:Major Facilitator Superfamily [Popillia japonica]|uniref:Major Facilitator Superfamily n=1 Tax=Popillia japonica TaxID=7064 RepID=A0AAW1N0D7_POPJA